MSPGFFGQRRVRRDLRLQAVRIVGQHVDVEQVGNAVAVDVGDVEAHRRIAHLTLRRPIGETEVAVAVVEPELVEVLEIVADVEIGHAVAVQVDELRVERERLGLLGQRLARSHRGIDPT